LKSTCHAAQGPEEVSVRIIYLAIVILFALATIVFAVQNLQVVTIGFLGVSASVPLALLVAVSYVLGAVTGGSLFALLRRSYEGSRRGPLSPKTERDHRAG
jgi:lipopolysaccharide assembly protein A